MKACFAACDFEWDSFKEQNWFALCSTEAAEAKFRASKRLRLWSLLSLLEPRGIRVRGPGRLAIYICKLSRIPLTMCVMEAGILIASCADCLALPRAWWRLLRLQRKEAPALHTT